MEEGVKKTASVTFEPPGFQSQGKKGKEGVENEGPVLAKD